MKKTLLHNIIRQTAAGLLSLCLTISGSAVASDSPTPDTVREQMNVAKSAALSYLKGANYYFAYTSLGEYAALARTLADGGELHPYLADTAESLRDAYRYAPEIYAVTDESTVFMGSDGYFSKNANAVRLNVTLGYAPLEDYLHLIPQTSKELCILVALNAPTERSMIKLAAGELDESIIRDLRTMGRLEGRVYLSFCPAINNKSNSRSLHLSYIAAFRHIADLARRYAPNVQTVYSLGDKLTAGDNTVTRFYPGDSYVDVLGVELTLIPRSLHPTEEEQAWNGIGAYYDPVHAADSLAEDFAAATGRNIPLMVTGCSFPWDGYYAREDWESAMEEFYTTLPLLRPELVAIFYKNESNSYGVCNLRQNKTAAALYERCITLAESAVPLESVTEGTGHRITVYNRRIFASATEVYLNGKVTDGRITLTEGDNLLEVYVTGDYFYSKSAYTVTLSPSGTVTTAPIVPDFDYNGNGILDFGDSEMLSAYIAKWQVDMGGITTDVNGDGRTNIRDLSSLEQLITP